MVSKKSQIQKDILNNSIYIQDSEKKNMQRQKTVADVQDQGLKRSICKQAEQISSQDDENILRLNCGNTGTTQETY